MVGQLNLFIRVIHIFEMISEINQIVLPAISFTYLVNMFLSSRLIHPFKYDDQFFLNTLIILTDAMNLSEQS